MRNIIGKKPSELTCDQPMQWVCINLGEKKLCGISWKKTRRHEFGWQGFTM